MILDACRYDIFKGIYCDYLEGRLQPVETGVRGTGPWLVKTWPDFYDLIYISAMPHINSKGLALKDTLEIWDYEWTGREHFKEVVDVWEFGFVEKLGTVPPEATTETGKKVNNGKMVVHYAQPHFPSLELAERKENGGHKSPLRERKQTIAGKILGKLPPRTWKFTIFNFFSKLPMFDGYGAGMAGSYLSEKGIVYHYTENLRRVLSSLQGLLKERKGRTIISADHGEYLGEKGMLGHKEMAVPWLVIK